jgi:hypothetical protein
MRRLKYFIRSFRLARSFGCTPKRSVYVRFQLCLFAKVSGQEPISMNHCDGLSEAGMCYFVALIEGLRLINEKIAERPELGRKVNYCALARFVEEKGQMNMYLLGLEQKEAA